MSQKSILSFFKKSEGDSKIIKKVADSETPSKKATKRKRSSIEEKKSKIKDSKKKNGIAKVSQENDSEPISVLNGSAKESPPKQDVKKNSSSDNDVEKKESSQSYSKKKKTEEEFSPVKTSKRKRVKQVLESDDDDNVLSSKEDQTCEKHDTSTTANHPPDKKVELSSTESKVEIKKLEADLDASTSDYIPKRKTARKQVKSSRKCVNGKVKKESEEEESKPEKDNICSSTEEKVKPNNFAQKQVKSRKSNKKAIKNESGEEESKSENDNHSSSDENKTKADHSDGENAEDPPQSKDKKPKKELIHPFFKTEAKSVEDKPQKPASNTKTQSLSACNPVYDPSKNNYHPIDNACWKNNEKVPYLALAKTLELIESTSARLKIAEILSNFFRSVIVLSPDDLLQSVYLCLNRLAPEYEGIELGVGETILMKAVAQATGRTFDKIKAEVGVKGDLGSVAESSRGNQKLMFTPPKLTVSSVFSKFKEIAQMSGNSAMAKKTDKIQALFVACRDCEAKYIIRSLSGKLRIGLAEQSVLAALARAATLTPPGQSYPPPILDASSKKSSEKFKEILDAKILTLKTTYCECPNYDIIIPILVKEGIDALPKHCQLCPGRPLKPMLAHPTTSVEEVLKRFENNEFTCEFKYDGERAQIHMTDDGEVSIYSRNQENNVSKYPDVISRLPKIMKEGTKSFILDSEVVAWDSQSKQILPFTVLSTRKRKDAVESEIVVHVCVMVFDLLYFNGESLVKKTLKERRALLHSAFEEIENEFLFVTYKDGNSAETMQEFLEESVKGNCEGLMIKALEIDASYEIAKRSHNWLKLKKDYLNGVGDTLDLVVIGGYFGKGKRAGTYGGFLLACYDDENEEFQTICKLGVGFKDEDLDTHTKFFKQHIIKEPKSYYVYDQSLEPDDWFEPVQIWEIKCADMSISPIHKAASGIVDPVKGISLRFPRYIRIRDDKTKPEDSTVSSQVAKMYQSQSQIQNIKKSKPAAEEDFY